MTDNFTARERTALSRRQPTARNPLKAIIWSILITLALVAFALDHFTHLTAITHAEPIRQNDYYCDLLTKATANRPLIVVGATTTQLKAVCPNLK